MRLQTSRVIVTNMNSKMGPVAEKRKWKFIEGVLATSALIAWVSFAALWIQYDHTRPIIPSVLSGRVHVLNTHGHVVYLTEIERRKISTLNYSAVTLFLMAIIIDINVKPFRS